METVSSIRIIITIPVYFIFNADASTPGWSLMPNTAAYLPLSTDDVTVTNSYIFTPPELAAEASEDIVFAATVSEDIPEETSFNVQASITGNDTTGEQATSESNTETVVGRLRVYLPLVQRR